MFGNDFASLLRLPDVCTVEDEKVNIPVDNHLLVKLQDLADGGRYVGRPRYGGLSKLRTTVSDLSKHQDNLARRREAELEQALVEQAPELLGMPSWLCTVSAVSGRVAKRLWGSGLTHLNFLLTSFCHQLLRRGQTCARSRRSMGRLNSMRSSRSLTFPWEQRSFLAS